MKKIALFVSVLLLAGSLFAAAPAFEAKPGISGDATLTFGVSLDSPVATGFANATSSNITLGLINKATDEKGGKEGEEVYGWIKLTDFEMKIAAGDTPTLTTTKPGVEAKLFLGPVYINILGVDKTADKAGNIQEATISKVVSLSQGVNEEFKGFSIGLKDTSVVDLSLGVSSKFDWDAVTNAAASSVTAGAAITYKTVLTTYTLASNELYVDATGGFTSVQANAEVVSITVGGVATNYNTVAVFATPAAATAAGTATRNDITTGAYNFFLGAALKAVPGLTAEVAANLTTDTGNTVGAGVKVGYDIAVAEGIKITPSVGFDMAYSSALAYQLTGDVFVSFPGAKKKFTMQKAEIEYSPGFEVKYTMGSATGNPMDLGVYLWDADLIPVLNLFAAFEIANLGNAAQAMGLGVNAAADLGVVAPFATFKYASGSPATTNLEVGTDIKAITNTTFTLKYSSGNLTAATVGLGTITFATKIAY